MQPFGAGSEPSSMVDAGCAVGSIQIPAQPIVLHRIAFSGGGSVMVATLIRADMDVVARGPTRSPDMKTRFVTVDLDTALRAGRDRGDPRAAAIAALG